MKTILILSVAALVAGCSPGWVKANNGPAEWDWVGCHVVTNNPSSKGAYAIGFWKDLDVGEKFYWKQLSPDGTVGSVTAGRPC